MARKSKKLPTYQEIERLYKRGNIDELRRINESLAKTANQRMAQLYKSGIKSSEALARAKYYIYQVSEIQTGGVFSRSKRLTADQLKEQLKEELIFLRSESSTVSGEKRIRAEKSFETLTTGRVSESGNLIKLDIPEDINPPEDWEGNRLDYFKEQFFKFLEQDVWKDIRKYIYTNENVDVLQQAGEAIARGASISDLNKAYKSYLKKEINPATGRRYDIYSVWNNWTSIK